MRALLAGHMELSPDVRQFSPSATILYIQFLKTGVVAQRGARD
jgi:hypothetical protein